MHSCSALHATLPTRVGIVANIVVGERIKVSRVEKCVSMAGLGKCLARLPLGLQTELDSVGHPLSHGERRQVCLARALYERAPGFLPPTTCGTSSKGASGTELELASASFDLSAGRMLVYVGGKTTESEPALRLAI